MFDLFSIFRSPLRLLAWLFLPLELGLTHHGSEGVVLVTAAAVAEINDFELTIAALFDDDTPLNELDKTTHATARKEWSVSFTCFWDQSDTAGQVACAAGNTVTLHLQPEGGAVGDIEYTGTARITEETASITIGSITTASFKAEGSGVLTRATL